MIKTLALVLLLVALVAVSGCVLYSNSGTLQIRVTDKPVSGDVSSLVLAVSKVEVHQADNNTEDDQGQETNDTDETGWTTALGPQIIDLIQLKGVENILGNTQLQSGKYTQIRVRVIGATITIDNVTNDIEIPSNSIKFIHPFDIVSNQTTTLVIDFNADDSVIQAGSKYILKPVVRIFTRNETENTAEIKSQDSKQACENSGGTVKNSVCCKSASDFPNTCLVGACGCSLQNSHGVKVCDCGEGKCWDGKECKSI
ncbi:hypothetical protein A3K64_03060 [Candidatus Micrarchaeota archaeon RBG_16_36_9]|nr:MAG: hypothetical protein A3K64_03060 [Candidatus Micrarchaeota archaeon RBG_16_36_9]